MSTKLLLAWGSDAITDPVRCQLPAGITTLAHDGPALGGAANWRRVPRAASADLPREAELQAWYWAQAWAASPVAEALAIDELIAGTDAVDGWLAQLAYLRWECDQQHVSQPPVALTFNASVMDEALVTEALRGLDGQVRWWVPQLFLESRRLEPALAKARDLMAWTAKTVDWGKVVLLFNVSDRRDYFGSGSYYAVGGPDGSGLAAVMAGYDTLWREAGTYGLPAGAGLWSAQYVSPVSRAAFEALLVKVGYYPYAGI